MQANRKENEHVENSLRQPCDLVFRTAVLRCSILHHREAAARNPEICRRGQVHGCRKADVIQALRRRLNTAKPLKGNKLTLATPLNRVDSELDSSAGNDYK